MARTRFDFGGSLFVKQSPCYNAGADCPLRRVGCRESCEKWENYRNEIKVKKEEIRKLYGGGALADSYAAASAERYKEKMRRKANRKEY